MDNFVNRLEFLLQNLEITASAFADKIGVQRSSLSHLLSGRNKPSLDFILKINNAFPELSLEWLLKGDGNYLAKDNTTTITKIIQTPPSPASTLSNANPLVSKVESEDPPTYNRVYNFAKSDQNTDQNTGDFPTEKEVVKSADPLGNFAFDNSKGEIEQVVIFYKDGTFSQFKPR